MKMEIDRQRHGNASVYNLLIKTILLITQSLYLPHKIVHLRSFWFVFNSNTNHSIANSKCKIEYRLEADDVYASNPSQKIW